VNIKELKELIDKVCESGIAEVEVSGFFRKIVIRRLPSGSAIAFSAYQPMLAPMPVTQLEQISSAEVSSTAVKGNKVGELEKLVSGKQSEIKERVEGKAENITHITAPMVGTFYRTPAPGAEPYVKEGDKVKKGTIVCIIEAMKLMNEIESDCNGTIKEIHVENAKPVEYGQVLFTVLVD